MFSLLFLCFAVFHLHLLLSLHPLVPSLYFSFSAYTSTFLSSHLHLLQEKHQTNKRVLLQTKQGNGLNPLAHQFVPDLGYISNGFPPVYPPTVTTAFTSIPTTYAYAYDQRAVPHNTFVPPVYQPMQHQYSAPMMPMMPTMQTSHPGHGAISRLGYANGSGLNPTAAPFFFPNMTPRTMAPAPLHYDQDFDYAFNGYMPTLGDGVNDSTTLRPLNASQRKRPRLDDDDQDEHSVAVPPAKKAKIGTENNGEVGVPGEVTKLDYDEFLNFTPSKDGNVTDASRNSQQQADLTRPVDTTFEPVHLTRPFTPLHHNSPDLQRTTVSPKDLQVVADQVVQSSEPVESYDEPGVVHSMSQWHSHGNQFEEDYGHLPATGLQSFNHPIAGQAIVDLHRPSYNYPSPLIPSESFIPAGHSHHITHTSYRAPEPNMGDSQPTECRSSSSTNASTRRQATRRSTTTSNSSRSRSRYTSDEESEARRQRDELFVQLKDSGLGYKEIKERMGLTEADSTLRGRYRALKKDKKDRVRRPVWSDVDDAVLRSIIEEKTAAQGGPLNLIKISYKLVQEEMGAAGRYRFGYAALKKRAERLFKNSGNGATEADETDSQATEPASTEADQDLAGNTGVGSNVNDPYAV